MRYSLLAESPIWGCGALIPKCAFERCGLFDLEHRYVSDVEMFFRIAEQFPFVTIDEPLGASRRHKAQMTFAKMHLHQTQSNWFLKNGIQKISDSDLQEAGTGNIDRALWQLAFQSKKNGYAEAGQEAWNRMKDHTISQYLKFYYAFPLNILWKRIVHIKRQVQIRF